MTKSPDTVLRGKEGERQKALGVSALAWRTRQHMNVINASAICGVMPKDWSAVEDSTRLVSVPVATRIAQAIQYDPDHESATHDPHA